MAVACSTGEFVAVTEFAEKGANFKLVQPTLLLTSIATASVQKALGLETNIAYSFQ